MKKAIGLYLIIQGFSILLISGFNIELDRLSSILMNVIFIAGSVLFTHTES